MRTSQHSERITPIAMTGVSKPVWLAHVSSEASATHQACTTIYEHDGRQELFRRLVLLSINVKVYETGLESGHLQHHLYVSAADLAHKQEQRHWLTRCYATL